MSKNNRGIVRLEHLSHYYGKKPAIRDISISFNSKGIYGLLGSNGAGKSTTMNIMCGVLKPTSGQVFIQDISLSQQPELAKQHLGFLPQRPPLYPELTVREYLRYAAGLRQIPAKSITRSVEEVIDQCMLSSHQYKTIGALSGGYQQRVGIAQSIIHKPNIVVFDEPTNGLDPNQIESIRALIQQIGELRTVILSTHILSEVEASCDHICMIEQGRLIFSGSIETFNNYLHPNSVYIHLGQPPSTEVLEKLDFIESVDPIDAYRFKLHFKGNPEAILDQLVSISVEKKWLLRELKLEKNSAEKIFAALSHSSQA